METSNKILHVNEYLAKFMPAVSDETDEELLESIENHGVKDAIRYAMIAGVATIIDGHRRYAAARHLGKSFPAELIREVTTVHEAEEWMIKFALTRRDLTSKARKAFRVRVSTDEGEGSERASDRSVRRDKQSAKLLESILVEVADELRKQSKSHKLIKAVSELPPDGQKAFGEIIADESRYAAWLEGRVDTDSRRGLWHKHALEEVSEEPEPSKPEPTPDPPKEETAEEEPPTSAKAKESPVKTATVTAPPKAESATPSVGTLEKGVKQGKQQLRELNSTITAMSRYMKRADYTALKFHLEGIHDTLEKM